MALRLWASKTASYLRISTFQRGFASELNKKRCIVLLGDKHFKVFEYQAASHLRFSVFHRGFASVVKDLKYADTHEWVKVEGSSAIVGITDHAQDHLGDVVYVELPEVGASVTQGNSFGAIESVKATSDINSPISGKVVEVNEELNDSPGLVNGSPYENGWIMKVELSNNDELNSLMDSDKYSKFCEEEDANH